MQIHIPFTQKFIEITIQDGGNPKKWPHSKRVELAQKIDSIARCDKLFMPDSFNAKVTRIRVARETMPLPYRTIRFCKEWVEKCFWNNGEGEVIQ